MKKELLNVSNVQIYFELNPINNLIKLILFKCVVGRKSVLKTFRRFNHINIIYVLL